MAMKMYNFLKCIRIAAGNMAQYREMLCLLDTAVGDGDHGVTIARGYQKVVDQVPLTPDTAPAAFLESVGLTMSSSMGGAIGPVYGIFYSEIAKTFLDVSDLDTPLLAKGMRQAVEQIKQICQVNTRDKTVVDAMEPTVKALENAGTQPLLQTLTQAVQKAEEGRDNTADMVARKGRAKYNKERSVGQIDAGACSFACWLKELTNAVARMEGDTRI
jgi:dihydroxyacetone kinase phosphoprotein-dependent L subunit